MKRKITKLIFFSAAVSILSIYLPVPGLSTARLEHAVSQHENVGETHQAVAQPKRHTSSSEHSNSAEHHTSKHEDHHIWWQFPGYEIVLGALSCLYFALFIIIVPYFFGKNLEEHH